MKKLFFYFVVILLVSAMSFAAHAETFDKIAVIVNDEIITDGEIERTLISVFQRYRTMYQGNELLKRIEEAREKIVEQLIDEKLLLCEAKRLNIQVTDDEISGRIDEAAGRFGSRAAFEKILSEQRMTIKDLRAKYTEQIMVKKLVGSKAGSVDPATPMDITNFYKEHSAEFFQPGEIKLRNIMIRSQGDDDKAYALAEEVLSKLKSGEDFSGLAKTYSSGPGAEEGGLMGYVKPGELLPEIEAAVFSLNEGEISGIVKTGIGYHIFKIEEKRDEKKLSLSDARKDIEEAIFRERANDKIKNWVADLKKNAYIAFK